MLRAPTISGIIRQLEEEKLIISCGKGEGNPNGGPQPEMYRINSIGQYFIGIDIGFDDITAVLLNCDLNEVDHQRAAMTK